MTTPAPTPRPLTILTGASRGMGLAMAQQLLDAGHQLVTMARQINPQLQDYAQRCQAHVQQWTYDLSAPESAAQALQQWLQQQSADRFSQVTLINNAGAIPPIAPLSATDWQAMRNALRVNLEAPMLLTSAFLQATESWPIPKKVLNISSGLGRRAMASQATYCASKAGLDNFTASVALEEARKPHGARLCALAPGVIDTDMQIQLRSAQAHLFPDVARFQHLKREQQLTSPHDAARQVLACLEDPHFGHPVIADVRQR